MKEKNDRASHTIKSVEKALILLEVLSELEGDINLTHLSQQLGMNKSGVHRILQVLKKKGFVEQQFTNGKYQLGLTAFRVGQNIVSNNQHLKLAKPLMSSLVNEHNETVYLTLDCDGSVLFFENIDSSNAVNIASLKGRYYSVDKCAAGLVASAFSSAYTEIPNNSSVELTCPHICNPVMC